MCMHGYDYSQSGAYFVTICVQDKHELLGTIHYNETNSFVEGDAHIIRSETEYQNIWKYIDENPLNWANDDYYIKTGVKLF